MQVNNVKALKKNKQYFRIVDQIRRKKKELFDLNKKRRDFVENTSEAKELLNY